jgi:GH18 family chitinase
MLARRRIQLLKAVLWVASLAWAGCASGDTPSKTGASPAGEVPPSGRIWVTGYYAGWYWDWLPSPEAAVAAVDMSTMTHFVFGRYAPGGGTLGGAVGHLAPGAGTGHAAVEGALIARAHRSGVKALAMLGGGGDGEGFAASTAPSVRSSFIANILDMCVSKDYDGVDVDWEEGLDPAARRDQLVAFLTELRAAAGARPRYQAPSAPFVITFPGFAVNVNTDLPVPAWKVTVAALVDQYNLMTYGQNFDAPGWQTWFFSALKDAGASHPTSVESSIRAYVDAGVPRGKLGMGIGLYASYYYPPVTGPRQVHTGGGGFDDNFDHYAALHRRGLFEHASGTYVWDEAAQAGFYRYSPPVAYQKASWAKVETIGMLTAEEPRGIAAKGAWARAGGCGGTIVWTVNYGFVNPSVGNPPMEAVKKAFLTP